MSHTAPSLKYVVLRLSSASVGEGFGGAFRTRGSLLIALSYDMDISCLMESGRAKDADSDHVWFLFSFRMNNKEP